MVHDLRDDGVLPEMMNRLRDVLAQRPPARAAVDLVVQDPICVLPVARKHRVDADLAHREDDRLRALEEVAVDRLAVGGELGRGVPVLVDDLHLLDDGGLPGLA